MCQAAVKSDLAFLCGIAVKIFEKNHHFILLKC